MAGKPKLGRTLAASVALVALAITLLSVAAAPARDHGTVRIRDFTYRPATLTVTKGSRVTFSNSDSVPHTATDKGAFSTGRIKGGKSVTVRFTKKGTFSYLCTIHPEMRGKIIVK